MRIAFWLAFGTALTITAMVELIRWARDRGDDVSAISDDHGRARHGRHGRADCTLRRRRPYAGRMIALVPVRDGVLPAGCRGGDRRVRRTGRARRLRHGRRRDRRLHRRRPPRRARSRRTGPMGAALAAIVGQLAEGADTGIDTDIVVLPHSPDGRDLAPRLARGTRPAAVLRRHRGHRAPRPPGAPWRPRTPRAPPAADHSSRRWNPVYANL